MNLYAYCISYAGLADAVESEQGVNGGKPYLLEQAGITTIVSECGDEPVAITRANVLAHERVVQRVLAKTTPLPFRFGTVVDEMKLGSFINSQAANLKTQLDRVRGCVEMGIKIIWKRNVEGTAAEDPKPADNSATTSTSRETGTAFLMRKQRELQGDRESEQRAAEVSAWLAEVIGSSVRATSISMQPSENLILAAAHLVERTQLEEYRRRLKQAETERPELHFLTSGAWPPYSFTIINS